MYAYRLCEALGLDLADGVVRLSLVHYNTAEEVTSLLDALDTALAT
jgi:selenocysteine lyase/cysteine desulfurase